MKTPKKHLLASVLVVAGLVVPGALGGVIQLSSGTDTVLDWKSSSTQGAIDNASIYLMDSLNYSTFEGSDYYSAGRGNLCGVVIALQAPTGGHLEQVNINVASFVPTWGNSNCVAYGTYKAGPASTLSPGSVGTQFIWDFWGDTQTFYHNAVTSVTSAHADAIHLDFTGQNYDYAYLGFFLSNGDLYDWQNFRMFNSASNGTSPGLVITSVIPEPATVGLLALGGLALLRRRRS